MRTAVPAVAVRTDSRSSSNRVSEPSYRASIPAFTSSTAGPAASTEARTAVMPACATFDRLAHSRDVRSAASASSTSAHATR
ncbi:hypothetical protein [Frankia sp. Cj5]|uniref:hypothetical protein n=1 Tax=Frankia sp. Cj5 TaxID=2880978 RepID=UPI001EF72B1A|nr:hypothetical protein [Frankia sp. Cj5]